MSAVETLLAEVACRADDSMYHHERTDDFPCFACLSLAAEQAKALREWLTRVGVVEAIARTVAGLAGNEAWPTNEALGGSLTGTRDDEFHDACHDAAKESLTVLADLMETGP